MVWRPSYRDGSSHIGRSQPATRPQACRRLSAAHRSDWMEQSNDQAPSETWPPPRRCLRVPWSARPLSVLPAPTGYAHQGAGRREYSTVAGSWAFDLEARVTTPTGGHTRGRGTFTGQATLALRPSARVAQRRARGRPDAATGPSAHALCPAQRRPIIPPWLRKPRSAQRFASYLCPLYF